MSAPTHSPGAAARADARPTDAVVVDSVDLSDRIDDHSTSGARDATDLGAHGAGGRAERAVPYFCPFCAEEDLRPHDAARGAWHCRSCLRTFTVTFHGLAPLRPSPAPHASRPAGPALLEPFPAGPANPDPTETPEPPETPETPETPEPTAPTPGGPR